MHMKILKRNQIIISVIALMLITVGYMNYSSSISRTMETSAELNSEIEGTQTAGIGDARLVDSQNATEVISEEAGGSSESSSNSTAESSVSEKKEETTEQSSVNYKTENTKEVSSSNASYATNYFATSRIERDSMYSEMIETYENLLANASISSDQKQNSTQEITKINNKKNSIMIAENLIKNLGFEDAVIFFNDNSVSVIVKAETLQDADVAQIQNVVCRELGVSAEMVHISVR